MSIFNKIGTSFDLRSRAFKDVFKKEVQIL